MSAENYANSTATMPGIEHGSNVNQLVSPAFFTGDNISADDIIGPEYLSFDLNQPAERKLLACYAFANIADKLGPFCTPGNPSAPYQVIIAGERFGYGSGRRQPAAALAEAGVKVILAKSYGEGFYRTCVNEGGILPLILLPDELNWSSCSTGMRVWLALTARTVVVEEAGITANFEDPGVTLEITVAGGLQRYLNGSRSK